MNADLLHVDQQRLSVVVPLHRELAGMRELITGQLHGHLKTVGVKVAEIVHTYRRQTFTSVFSCLLLIPTEVWVYFRPLGSGWKGSHFLERCASRLR